MVNIRRQHPFSHCILFPMPRKPQLSKQMRRMPAPGNCRREEVSRIQRPVAKMVFLLVPILGVSGFLKRSRKWKTVCSLGLILLEQQSISTNKLIDRWDSRTNFHWSNAWWIFVSLSEAILCSTAGLNFWKTYLRFVQHNLGMQLNYW